MDKEDPYACDVVGPQPKSEVSEWHSQDNMDGTSPTDEYGEDDSYQPKQS